MGQDSTPDASAEAGGAVTSTTLVLVLTCLGVIGYLIYDKLRFKDVWARYGVLQPNISASGIVQVRTFFDTVMKTYGDTIGMVLPGRGQVLVTQDLTLLRDILVKDFNNFVDRPGIPPSKAPLALNVFFADRNNWKRFRQITSPSFSTGKLKAMTETIEDSAKKVSDFFVECARNGRLVPLKDTSEQYTSAIIARTTFGLKTDSIGKTEEDIFIKYTRNMFKQRWTVTQVVLFLLSTAQSLMEFLVVTLRINFFDPYSEEACEYFRSIVRSAVPERREIEKSGGRKPVDFLQAFVTPKPVGKGEDGEFVDLKPFTDEELLGQMINMIFAGFETTASTLQMVVYMMALHPEVQEKVFQEIMTNVTSDSPTHEELTSLKYTEQVINETQRMYPVVPFLDRQAKDKITYGDIAIPAGAVVLVPIVSILKDPRHWPNPEKFDPDRFTEEAKSKRDPMAFMAFGFGPRLCVGQRLAILELKTVLVHTMRKVRFELNDTTEPKRGEEFKEAWSAILMFKPETPLQMACVERK